MLFQDIWLNYLKHHRKLMIHQEYYKILYLNTRTDPHQANLKQDYSKFQALAKEGKKNEVLTTWLESHIQDTYVRVDPLFLSCPNVSQWIKKDK